MSLRDREYQLLHMLYWEGLTMKETGEIMGINESRVSQLHSATIDKLLAVFVDMGFTSFHQLSH
jgi:RNA polymerase sigma factor for flagellar operon FliA